MGIAAVGYVASREHWALTPVTRAAVALLACVIVARGLLLVAPIEYIHLPQYALLSVLLVKGGLPMEWAWLAATSLGALDEGYQFVFLRRGRPEYYDWNDIVLNAIGAGFGLVLLAAGRAARFRRTFATVEVAVVVAIAALVAMAIVPVQGAPWLTQTPRGEWFRILSPVEGIVMVAAVWAASRQLGRT
jgi:phosphatidylserine synthase